MYQNCFIDHTAAGDSVGLAGFIIVIQHVIRRASVQLVRHNYAAQSHVRHHRHHQHLIFRAIIHRPDDFFHRAPHRAWLTAVHVQARGKRAGLRMMLAVFIYRAAAEHHLSAAKSLINFLSDFHRQRRPFRHGKTNQLRHRRFFHQRLQRRECVRFCAKTSQHRWGRRGHHRRRRCERRGHREILKQICA